MARTASVREALDADARMNRKMEKHAAEVRRLRAALRESDARWRRTLAYVCMALYRATTSSPRGERAEAALGRVWMFMESARETALTVTEAMDRHPEAACTMVFWYEDEEELRCLAVVTTGTVRRAVTQFRGRTLEELLAVVRRAGLKPGRRPTVMGLPPRERVASSAPEERRRPRG
jgi:hypothetical protein